MRASTTSLKALCGCLLFMIGAEARAAIPASERAALIALYDSTNGAGWYFRTNWRNADDTDFAPVGTECSWFGVSCYWPGDHVSELSISNNQLSGSIPPEIGNLSQLTGLRLNSAQLTGPIPPEIGRLSQLAWLFVDNNQLSGSIPPEIGGLSQLAWLFLGNNQLTGPIPPEIGKLTNLGSLSLDNNQLSGSIPPEIGTLKQLWQLTLYNNRLTGSIPCEIGNLTNLRSLYIDGNQLSGPIPPEIGSVTSLGDLSLSNNQLSGSVPRQIGSLTKLRVLALTSNQLSGPIPPGIGNLRHLDRLSLSDNQLTGSIPPGIGNLTKLHLLSLLDNRLSGSIPPEIGNLRELLGMDLSGNQLSGPIPATLMSMTGLVDGWSDLRWNALYTSDAALRAFLNLKQFTGDWENAQTVAATGLAARPLGPGSATLRWTPILYIADTGGYRSWYGTIPGGPYSLAGMTADKATGAFSVSGLSPGTTYYFALDTVTEPHTNNQNTVVSERTAEVMATTATGGVGWYSLAVVREGPGTVSSSPGGIVCGGACSATFAPGTPVTLTAVPDAGSTFLGWGSACAGTALTCDLTLDSAQTVTATFSPPAVSFYTVTPCRVYDSRDAGLGGPSPLAAGTDTGVVIGGYCVIPPTAKAVSLNVTVVSPSTGGHLRVYPSGMPRPTTSSINYAGGQTRANNAVVSLGADGALIVYVNQPSGTVHVVLDVNGYFQ